MKKFNNGVFTGERALYNLHDTMITNSCFKDGESPLKETSNIVLDKVSFEYKYPLWYSNHISVSNSIFYPLSRSGIWYTNDISLKDCHIIAPKLFRRASNIVMLDCCFLDAKETFWNAENINLMNVLIFNGEYLCFNAKNITIKNMTLHGNYAFDGAEDIYIENSLLNSKDSLWNTKNVVIKDSKIIGEYIGWNSKNLTFINCEIESNQGFCYIDGLTLINCKLINTDLAFEFCSNVNADIDSNIISVKNPKSGLIEAKKIGKIILDNELIEIDNVEVKENE